MVHSAWQSTEHSTPRRTTSARECRGGVAHDEDLPVALDGSSRMPHPQVLDCFLHTTTVTVSAQPLHLDHAIASQFVLRCTCHCYHQ
jgi:hypothetical protein